MEKALQAINQLVKDKIVEKYAIGGAMATLFYIEPVATFDLDIMIILASEKNKLAPLGEIYDWARKQGYELHREHIIIEGIPVQILPSFNELIYDAIIHSLEKEYNGTPVNVISPEYLVAIMLDTFRPIDRERIHRFIRDFDLKYDLLNEILEKFNLKDKFFIFTGINSDVR